MNTARLCSGVRPSELSCATPALSDSVSRSRPPNIHPLDVSDDDTELEEVYVLGAGPVLNPPLPRPKSWEHP
jgi:hypothetical protein